MDLNWGRREMERERERWSESTKRGEQRPERVKEG